MLRNSTGPGAWSFGRSLVPTALGVALLLSAGAATAKDRFSAPTGQLGANLTLDPTQRFRLHTEMSYFTTTAAFTMHGLGWTFGAGIKVADKVEIELGVPVEGVILSSNGSSVDQFGVGNVSIGGNYFTSLGEQLRLKVGGLVAFGPWNQRNGVVTQEGIAVGLAGMSMNGYQDAWLHAPGVHVVVPGRIEYGEEVQATGDVGLHVAIPTLDGAETDVIVTVAPGIVYWPAPQFALGARLPLQLMTADDAAQVSLEPFLRLDVAEQAFLSTRFTMHLDEPLGFSFDTGRAWGLHLAFGGSF